MPYVSKFIKMLLLLHLAAIMAISCDFKKGDDDNGGDCGEGNDCGCETCGPNDGQNGDMGDFGEFYNFRQRMHQNNGGQSGYNAGGGAVELEFNTSGAIALFTNDVTGGAKLALVGSDESKVEAAVAGNANSKNDHK